MPYDYNIPDNSPSHADIGTGFYAYLINVQAWKMAAVVNDNVQLQSENAFRNQIWYFERQSDKSYKIINVATGKCLDVNNGESTNGTNVLVWNSNDNNNQRWYFTSKDGNYVIHPKYNTSIALDVSGGSKDEGANIQIWEVNGTAAQTFCVWKFDNKPNKPTVTSSSKTYAVGSNVTVSWGENAFATSYWVDIWHNGKGIESFGVNDTSYTIKNVTAGEYTVFVASCNPNGASETGGFTFNVPTYTISYNMNGGSGSIGNQTKNYNQDLTLSSTKPTRTGYSFVCWNTKSDGTGTNYNPGGKYTPNSGATLYAVWKANTYTVSYNMNGGSGSIGNQTKTYGVDLTLSSTKPTRTGYSFVCWNTKSDGTGTNYNPGGKYTPNSGAILYAVWKINTWTVSYNMNGGSGSISNQTKTYGVDLTLSSTKPTRTGYTFVGWNTSASATTAQYKSGDKYKANAGATLYAIWKINAPTDKPVISNLKDTYSEGSNLTFTWSKVDRATSYKVAIWRNPGNESTKIVDTSITTNSYTLTNMIPAKYGIIIYAQNESGSIGSDLYNFNVPQVPSTKPVISDLKDTYSEGSNLTFTWSKVDRATSYKVAIWRNPGNESTKIVDTSITTNSYTLTNMIPAKYGIIIYAQNESGSIGSDLYNFNVPQVPSTKPVISDLKDTYSEGSNLTFTWSKVDRATSYTVHIWRNPGGESTKIIETSVTNNSYTLENMIPAKYGIYVDAKNESGYIRSELYNFYVPFTIRYDLNGGTGTVSPTYKKMDIACNLSSTIPIRPGYDFVGWNTDKNATTAQFQPGAKYTANGNVTLYAIWKQKLTNTSVISENSIQLGNIITINAKAEGGAGNYKYAVYYKKATSDKWITAQSFKSNATVIIKPAVATKYNVCVKVKDSDGTIDVKRFTVDVYAELKNTSVISAESISLGERIILKAKATGGTGNYTYAVYYKKAAATKWITKQNFSSENKVYINPIVKTTYDVCVKVKDSSGKISKKFFKVEVK